MRFAFDEDALLFQNTLREFLRKEHPPERIRALWQSETGRSPELFRKLAELGVPGALVPEPSGGLGLDETALVLLLEEAGRAALAEPIVATAAVGAPLLRDLPAPALGEPWLARVAAGEARLAVGHPVSALVADAHVADLLLLAHEGALHAVPRERAALVPQPADDPSERLFSVRFAPDATTRVAEGARARALLDAALDRGALACAAELLGVTEQLLEMAVAYAGQREQFGRPIGSFQAVKHHLADVKVRLEYARPLVYRAAWSVAHGDPRRGLHVSMAKVHAAEAAAFAARQALQVHGAIGYTWEQDLHIWMRRAWSLGQAFGASAFHLERVAAGVLAEDAVLGPGTTF